MKGASSVELNVGISIEDAPQFVIALSSKSHAPEQIDRDNIVIKNNNYEQ